MKCQTCGKEFSAKGTRGPKPKDCPDCRRGNLSSFQIRINKIYYSWSKYGKKAKKTKHRDSWSCQACGKKMPSQLPGYLFEAFPREYIRICSDCQFLAAKEKITIFSDLIKKVR